MATITVSGTVTCKEGTDPVSLKSFDSGFAIAKFSVLDKESVYEKNEDSRCGQFYNVEVAGKPAEWCVDRISRNDPISVTGQLVQSKFNDKIYYSVRNARVTFLTRKEAPAAAAF